MWMKTLVAILWNNFSFVERSNSYRIQKLRDECRGLYMDAFTIGMRPFGKENTYFFLIFKLSLLKLKGNTMLINCVDNIYFSQVTENFYINIVFRTTSLNIILLKYIHNEIRTLLIHQ